MKKFFTALLFIVTAMFAFAGCAASSEQSVPAEDGIISERPAEDGIYEDKEYTQMFITVNGNKLKATLADNSSAEALIEILKRGDITYTADDYGGFEKVGNIGYNLPKNDARITTQAGDVILYQGNSLCLYYGTNTWNFTRIGKIEGYSVEEIRSLLGAGSGSVQVKLSLN